MNVEITLPAGEFARDSAVRRVSENTWEAELSPGWCLGDIVNGGYVMAVAARALSAALSHKDPLTVTAYYLARAVPGPVQCVVEVLRTGGSVSQGMVKVLQNGEVKVQLIAIFTDRKRLAGVERVLEKIPEMPTFEQCVSAPAPPGLTYRQRVVQKMSPANVRSLQGEPDGSGRWLGWTAFADGSAIDAFGLLLFADGFPPPPFTLYGPSGWVPTLELTVQIHGLPAPGPLRCMFKSDIIKQGIVEEQGLIWDSADQLVVGCRQTAMLRISPPAVGKQRGLAD